MNTKISLDLFLELLLLFRMTLNEYQRRIFYGALARFLGPSYIAKIFSVNIKTVYAGVKELQNGNLRPANGKIRRSGGGRKKKLAQHPEWKEVFVEIAESNKAGLPQDEAVVWLKLTVAQIVTEMRQKGCDVSRYIVCQLIDFYGYKKRSFVKDLPMKDVEDRDKQFAYIKFIKKRCKELNIPILSIDTKKKEMIGNFKRNGTVLCQGRPAALDHDFLNFADAQIVPHGIYDVSRNAGYMTIGISHDTSEFISENIERFWNNYLAKEYPNANTIVILCDGGGSNSSSHHIFKQDLMNLANRLNKKILVVHYPPYSSKYNPIEHYLFSQITRSWQGAPLMSIEDAAERAAKTTTSTGLTVKVDIITKTYNTKRRVSSDYKSRLKRQIVFREELPKWSYLVKPEDD